MKYFVFTFFSIIAALSCNQGTAGAANQSQVESPSQGTLQDDPDLKAINETIHGFYAWYAQYLDDTPTFDITDDEGIHLKLDAAKLDAYYGQLRASGFISEEYIAADRKFWTECERLWQDESKDEIPSCLDYDRFFCAQDWDIPFWTGAPVSADGLGTNKVKALMSGLEAGSPREQKFELVKEREKWKISSIVCE